MLSHITALQVVLLFFAAVLLFSSFKLLSAGDNEDEDDDLSQNFIVKTCKCVIAGMTALVSGQRSP